MIDDLLLQEIYSLREQIKIMTRMLKSYEPDLDVPMFLHSLGHCDFQDYIEYYQLAAEQSVEPDGEDAAG